MKKKMVLFLLIAGIQQLEAKITLPRIFTSHMVLQRDRELKVWGWADQNEKVTVAFNGQQVSTKADRHGNWIVRLKAMPYGGPFDMKINGRGNSIMLTDVLLGDVWICSGQSNMEWILKNTSNATTEIAAAAFPSIRLFTVEKAMAYTPQKDLKGGEWLTCTPKTAADFSAVAYYFGKKLNTDLNIPIGLINSSWGGTNVQTWISWDRMSLEPGYKDVDLGKLGQEMTIMNEQREKFNASLADDIGTREKWFNPASNIEGWKKIQLPQLWESTEIGNADGVVWFKKEFELSTAPGGDIASLHLGPIDDKDETYLNGQRIGSTDGWNADRGYQIPAGLLITGKNTIVVKVTDTGGGGGIYGKEEQLYFTINGERISLAGEWQYQKAVVTTDFNIRDDGPNSFPSQLFNAMIWPIAQYGIKGGIWYQGESNTSEAFKYRTLFADMIKDWRGYWGYDFPFLWVQLANFMQPDQQPGPSAWAELREAQSMTLKLPQTGQAVIIDIGEADDIHPRNKKDVGMRLALNAEKLVYNQDIVYSGPVYQSMEIEKGCIILRFTNTGSGLMAKDKYGYLKGFSIAGLDQRFVWAKAFIENGQVIVSSELVKDPVAVRYAWADNPDDANLYNKEGLPGSPFRTDSWKGITEK
jgi:sialate O-acetylesterase